MCLLADGLSEFGGRPRRFRIVAANASIRVSLCQSEGDRRHRAPACHLPLARIRAPREANGGHQRITLSRWRPPCRHSMPIEQRARCLQRSKVQSCIRILARSAANAKRHADQRQA